MTSWEFSKKDSNGDIKVFHKPNRLMSVNKQIIEPYGRYSYLVDGMLEIDFDFIIKLIKD